jgi:membrane associated rhomboid family serine protease
MTTDASSPLSQPSPVTDAQEPVRMINVPPVTLFIVALLTFIHIMRVYVLSAEEDQNWVLRFGFIPLHLYEYGLHSIFPWLSTITYSVLHFGWVHFFVNITGVLAFGSGVERAFGWWRYSIVMVLCIMAGALAHFALFSHDTVILGGISAGLSGLFALVIGLIQQRNGWRGLFLPALIWVLINIVIGYAGMPGQGGLSIAWIAHMGGFAMGLIALPVLLPAYRFQKQH